MLYFVVKIFLSAVLIAAISEISKRSSLLGAIFASVPLVSMLSMIWIYVDTHNTDKIVLLSKSIFWLVLSSLVMFLAFPLFIKLQWNFYVAMFAAIVLTVIAYFLLVLFLERFALKL